MFCENLGFLLAIDYMHDTFLCKTFISKLKEIEAFAFREIGD